ncbi:MAG: NifU family protein [Bacteroidia bacterium]|nr:NifU family protein [Bacteroidia bacterium]
MSSPDEILSRVEKALDTIRDYLHSDGGDVRVHGLSPDGTLEIELLGACSNCSMSEMTLKAGVEETVLRAVPEVHRVVTLSL